MLHPTLRLAVLLLPLTAFAVTAAPVPPEGAKEDAAVVAQIDQRIADAWKANELTPSAAADDHAFLRRVSLDLVGRVARPAEIERYFKDPKESRRDQLIDRLLASPDHARYWSALQTDWLLPATGPFADGAERERLRSWLEKRVADNQGWDRTVTQLLTASGKTTDDPAAVFLLAQVPPPRKEGVRTPPEVGDAACTRGGPPFGTDDTAAAHYVDERVPEGARKALGHFEMLRATDRISRGFLGVSMACARCHDHPFDPDIRQHNFWEVNAFLRQVTRTETAVEGREPVLALGDDPEVNLQATVPYTKRTGVVREARATFLPPDPTKEGAKLPPNTNGLARRRKLAEFLVAHPNFSAMVVNRTWALLFGRGLVDPVDELGSAHDPSHPELLEDLARNFKECGHDQRRLLRWLCRSRAYQLSHVANRTNDRADHLPLLARYPVRPLSERQLVQSLLTATRLDEGLEEGPRRELQEKWLRQLRATNPKGQEGGIALALVLMHGKEINDAIAREKGTVSVVLAQTAVDRQRVDALFLAALNRPASDKEFTSLQPRLKQGPAEDKAVVSFYHDLLWALLNSNEFALQH